MGNIFSRFNWLIASIKKTMIAAKVYLEIETKIGGLMSLFEKEMKGASNTYGKYDRMSEDMKALFSYFSLPDRVYISNGTLHFWILGSDFEMSYNHNSDLNAIFNTVQVIKGADAGKYPNNRKPISELDITLSRISNRNGNGDYHYEAMLVKCVPNGESSYADRLFIEYCKALLLYLDPQASATS